MMGAIVRIAAKESWFASTNTPSCRTLWPAEAEVEVGWSWRWRWRWLFDIWTRFPFRTSLFRFCPTLCNYIQHNISTSTKHHYIVEAKEKKEREIHIYTIILHKQTHSCEKKKKPEWSKSATIPSLWVVSMELHLYTFNSLQGPSWGRCARWLHGWWSVQEVCILVFTLCARVCALLWRRLRAKKPWISNRTWACLFLSVPLKPHEVNQAPEPKSLSICSTIASEASKRRRRSGYGIDAATPLAILETAAKPPDDADDRSFLGAELLRGYQVWWPGHDQVFQGLQSSP